MPSAFTVGEYEEVVARARLFAQEAGQLEHVEVLGDIVLYGKEEGVSAVVMRSSVGRVVHVLMAEQLTFDTGGHDDDIVEVEGVVVLDEALRTLVRHGELNFVAKLALDVREKLRVRLQRGPVVD